MLLSAATSRIHQAPTLSNDNLRKWLAVMSLLLTQLPTLTKVGQNNEHFQQLLRGFYLDYRLCE